MLKINILISILLFTTFSYCQNVEVDKIVAQIGNNIILQSDIQSYKLQQIQNNDSTILTDCAILEDLLLQNLLLNQAELDSISIPDAQVDGEMENRLRVIENQIGGKQKLEEFYGKTVLQIKNEFRPLIKKRLMTEEMQRSITKDVTISPKEVERFYKSLPDDSIPLINAQLSFQQIVCFPQITEEDRKKTKDKLEAIREGILKGKSFESQARIHSQDPGSANDGGKIVASRGMMVPEFEAALFNIKEGEISSVFQTDYGYHIVQLISRKGDDYVCRHILLVTEFNRESLNDASLKMEECYAKLKENQITWDEAVLLYSNDINTKQNKGIITNPITGEQFWSAEDLNQIDQQIFVLTSSLNKGDLTQPSLYFDFNEKKQGIRIVRLKDRIPPHKANLKDDYTLIQRATESDKKQKVLSNWVSDKIGSAFLRIDEKFHSCHYKYDWNKSL